VEEVGFDVLIKVPKKQVYDDFYNKEDGKEEFSDHHLNSIQ
jgi:hypothetical protein